MAENKSPELTITADREERFKILDEAWKRFDQEGTLEAYENLLQAHNRAYSPLESEPVHSKNHAPGDETLASTE